MNSPEVVALMLADGRLPTGGHTQSAGLEPAVRAGLGADGKQLADVADYARDRLRTITRVEAAVAAVARHITLSTPSGSLDPSPSRRFLSENPPATDPNRRLSDNSAEAGVGTGTCGGVERYDEVGAHEFPWTDADLGGSDGAPGGGAEGYAGADVVVGEGDGAAGGRADGSTDVVDGSMRSEVMNGSVRLRVVDGSVRLGVVEAAWAARTPSQVLRAASRRQGRAYLRLAGRVWPDVLRYLRQDSEVARPVAVGVIGAVTGLSAEQVARLVAYDDVQSVVAASLKLLPVDPADAAGWLAGLHDDIERLVTDVAPLTEIDKIPADGAPLIDVLAQNHANERMRLFHA